MGTAAAIGSVVVGKATAATIEAKAATIGAKSVSSCMIVSMAIVSTVIGKAKAIQIVAIIAE